MILTDGGLAAAVRAAWKKMGYTATQEGGRLILRSPLWYVSCPLRVWPRKALGTVVEHIGQIPEEGAPICIIKGDGPQYVLEAEDQAARRALTAVGVVTEASATHVAVSRQRIFQARDFRVWGVSEDLLKMLDTDVWRHTSGEILNGESMIRWAGLDDDEEVLLLPALRGAVMTTLEPWERSIWSMLETIDCREPGSVDGDGA